MSGSSDLEYGFSRAAREGAGGQAHGKDASMSDTIERATLTAPDISCGHCVATIERALRALEGVKAVSASETTKQVTVDYDPSRVSLERIEATLDEEGYPVQK